MNNKIPQLSDDQVEALVLRRLRGELAGEAAEQLSEALADPRLARRAESLERSWQALELRPVRQESVAPQVLARLRSEQTSLALAPVWARIAGAAALIAGLGAGLNLDWGLEPFEATPELVQNGSDLFDADETGFAESLWFAAETDPQDEGEAQ